MNVYIGRTGKHGQVPGSRDPLEAKEVATRRKTRQVGDCEYLPLH